MNEFAIYGIFLAVWFSLQLWILPKMGIPTCMSGACAVPPKKKEAKPAEEETDAP